MGIPGTAGIRPVNLRQPKRRRSRRQFNHWVKQRSPRPVAMGILIILKIPIAPNAEVPQLHTKDELAFKGRTTPRKMPSTH
jgi:hypothetical protein